ncbi:MAG: hypothetical protein FWC47_14590 [Oscillospiraceae bacterium]|nr:hypothetical protein [Oscillospiraceae bacterium]
MLLALVFMSIAGTTFALFTDYIDLGSTTYTSGGVDLTAIAPVSFVHVDNANSTVVDSFVAPDDRYVFGGTIQNQGTLAAKVRVRVEEVDTNNSWIPQSGNWTIIGDTGSSVIAPNNTITLDGYELRYLRENNNSFQNQTYNFVIRVEAMQDRNTNLTDWDTVVLEHYPLP